MANDYLMVIGKRDLERFRRFRTGYDRDIIKSIDKFHDADNIWALGSSISDDLWSAIQKNDLIFFAEMDSTFNHCGIVSEKIIDKVHAIDIWGDSPRIRKHDRLLLFSSVFDMNESFNGLCKLAGVNPSREFTNIYLTENKISKNIFQHVKSQITGTTITSDDGIPNKKFEVVQRFIRDTKKVKQLKIMYHDECQICSYVINISAESRYSEVHHLRPLGNDGDDDFDNMIVLCPTHHVEFDCKIIGIDNDKKTIIDKNGKSIGTITMNKKHKLNEENIKFHLVSMNKNDLS